MKAEKDDGAAAAVRSEAAVSERNLQGLVMGCFARSFCLVLHGQAIRRDTVDNNQFQFQTVQSFVGLFRQQDTA